MCDYCGCRFIPQIAELSDEHDRLLDLAYRLRRHAEAGTRDAVLDLLDGEFVALLQRHTDKEERGVFAELRAIGDADDRLDALVGEHRDLELLVARVRRGGADWPATVVQLATELSGHVVDEEVDLFPYAMYELDDARWDAVARVHASEDHRDELTDRAVRRAS